MYAIILSLAQRSTSNCLYPSRLEAEISQDSIEYITYVENDLLRSTLLGMHHLQNRQIVWEIQIAIQFS